MLIRFIVENFLSFQDETEFNMLTSQFKIHKNHILSLNKHVDVLKIGSIYGANGSGKSNLVKAVDFLRKSVKGGEISRSIRPITFRPEKNHEAKPTRFEVEFGYGGTFFSYGLVTMKSEITEEWLIKLNLRNSDEDEKIFERTSANGKIQLHVNDRYLKTDEERLLIKVYQNELLEKSQLFLKLISKKIEPAKKAFDWFNNYLHIIYPDSKITSFVERCSEDGKFVAFANKMLTTFSTGIKKLEVKTIPLEIFFGEEDKVIKEQIVDRLTIDEEGETSKKVSFFPVERPHSDFIAVLEDGKPVIKKVVTQHLTKRGETIIFELDEESDGTHRLLDFIPAIEMITNEEKVVLIDEIDQSIHPALLKTLLKKLLENTESKGQFIFTTHESNLLDLKLFRQDEIWFAEKDEYGSSSLYSLSDYKPRYDLDIRKGYLKGRFGAIPFLGNLEDLNWNNTDA